MIEIKKIGIIILLLGIFLSGCVKETRIANPASVYCEEQGNRLEIRSNDNGQYGVCIFSDGSECEEWAYFRKECGQMCGGIAGRMCPEGLECNMQGKKYPDASGICVEPQLKK